MLNRILIILCALVLFGCSGSMKSSWNNFRAYYNTFHNAKKYYHDGLEQVKNQQRELNPDTPVRPHPQPVRAGEESFGEAIGKGARILRKFPESKWTDDALLLIGKSYYHRLEFHPALEKFEELYRVTSDDDMKHQAVIWKGITLLDLGNYEEGFSYLRSERENITNNWSQPAFAEVKIVEAEHHALSGNWEKSADLLSSAIGQIDNQELRGRSYFLFGQMLEKGKRYGEAYYAYSRVPENFSGFEYSYWAAVKQVEVARQDGNYTMALTHLNKLRNDDKYFDRRYELAFETARTYEIKGDIETAEEMYLNLLSTETEYQLNDEFRSAVYYRLGIIYSEYTGQFDLAEAYFDSASYSNSGRNGISDGEQAETLAKNYKTYNSLRSRIQRADSLLWLGSLTPVELDSVLQEIEEQNQIQQQNLSQQRSETIHNLEQPDEDLIASSSSRHGFLNYKNNTLVQEARNKFQLVWGDRPLMDNWRRAEAVETRANKLESGDTFIPLKGEAQQNESLADLENIPSSVEEREELRREIINAKYELGNLFFINMNQPDSARHYYLQVINQSGGDRDLVPRAMYSLFELYKVQDNSDSLHVWGEKILKEYADSKFAARVRNRLNIPGNSETDSTEKLRAEYQKIVKKETDSSAVKLRSLALANRNSELAPHIHYQAIDGYIRKAKKQAGFPDSSLTDSIRFNLPAAYTNSNSNAITYWDSVRMALQEHNSLFENSPHNQQISLLHKTLKEQQRDTVSTCEEQNIILEIYPDRDAFLEKINLPEYLDENTLSGSISYLFMVNRDGTIESYEVESQEEGSKQIEPHFEQVIENHLSFVPPEIKEGIEKIKCSVTFPIRN